MSTQLGLIAHTFWVMTYHEGNGTVLNYMYILCVSVCACEYLCACDYVFEILGGR